MKKDTYYDAKYISKVLQIHPKECVFELNAPAKIAERLAGKTIDDWMRKEYQEELRKHFSASEIYCPHEGINRLAECGVKSLDWELV